MAADKNEPDVIVVGGGPAGTSCARALARRGASVTLLHWNGYAVSGIELVSGRARHFIERCVSGFFQEAVQGVEIRETVSLWDTAEPVILDARLGPWGAGVAVERGSLDSALRRLASEEGVSVIEDAKVEAVTREKEGWRLLVRSPGRSGALPADKNENLLFFARQIVLATGRAAGQFFELPRLVETSGASRVALMTFLHAPPVNPAPALYVEAVENGWWSALPAVPGSYFIALCMERDALRQRGMPLKAYFMRELGASRWLGPLFRDGVLDDRALTGRNAGAAVRASAAGDGWLAVGDAAYAPGPLGGTGLELAIESGELAAAALLDKPVTEGRHGGIDIASYEKNIRLIAERDARATGRAYGIHPDGG